VQENVRQQVEWLVKEMLAGTGIELVDIEYESKNKKKFLRLFIEQESGVDLEVCADVSRKIKDKIDEMDVYYDYLEISSPGLDRKIKTDRELFKAIGKKIVVSTKKSFAGPRKMTGLLKGFDDNGLEVEINGETSRLPRDIISVIRLNPDL
jgi:ribosome maturation factor RimP